MTEQFTSWNNKHILKIKSEPLREVEFSNGEAGDTAQDSPESLRKEIEPWLTAYRYTQLKNEVNKPLMT